MNEQGTTVEPVFIEPLYCAASYLDPRFLPLINMVSDVLLHCVLAVAPCPRNPHTHTRAHTHTHTHAHTHTHRATYFCTVFWRWLPSLRWSAPRPCSPPRRCSPGRRTYTARRRWIPPVAAPCCTSRPDTPRTAHRPRTHPPDNHLRYKRKHLAFNHVTIK